MKNLVFVNSHPIQYFAPMYQAICKKTDISLQVLFCSKHGLQGETDKEFGVEVKWDIPVLEGYPHLFLKNHSPKPGIYGFFGLANLGIVPHFFKMPKSVVVVHGWGYFTNILALLAARLAGHTVALRGESPLSHEAGRSPRAMRKRHFFFKYLLFRLPKYFLYIGKENKAFYQKYGVPESKLIFCPYSVDNDRFRENHELLEPQKAPLKKALQLPDDKRIILFSGKYIDKKRPLDLLRAFCHCPNRQQGFLVFMGDGEQRKELEAFISKNNMTDVVLTGFVNQSKVPEYYAVADLFVMCSKEGETWGLSTNEAMNFSLPVLLSDLTGSSADLVQEGKNGWVFPACDTAALTEKLDKSLVMPAHELQQMGLVSKRIISRYSYDQVIQGLEEMFLKSSKNADKLRQAAT